MALIRLDSPFKKQGKNICFCRQTKGRQSLVSYVPFCTLIKYHASLKASGFMHIAGTCWLLCSVEQHVTVPRWGWLIRPFPHIICPYPWDSYWGERRSLFKACLVVWRNTQGALFPPAESKERIIESVENTTWAVRKYSAESFRARLPFFISCEKICSC